MSWVKTPACEDEEMKKLILLFALALPLIGQAEALQQVPWHLPSDVIVWLASALLRASACSCDRRSP